MVEVFLYSFFGGGWFVGSSLLEHRFELFQNMGMIISAFEAFNEFAPIVCAEGG